ncbi:exosome complex component MTR3-like [Liolophura sinensis]|uniref:exosome complex component MTR3-like n=1 Tax=Liolophura sinensis TaxID=3198878 RepID=UPI0031588CFE
MPGDSRRIAGPEETQNPYSFVKDKGDGEQFLLLNKEKLRADGRATDKVRPVFLKAGVISQAKGSAYIELDKTKAICAVYGPREVIKKEDFSMKGQLTCDFKFATFSCRYRRQHQQDNEEKDLSVLLLEALEPAVCLHKFPKAQLNIYLTVLENDGSVLPAAIMCASVAIADAGIEMYDLVTACSARISGKNILLDPSDAEEYRSQHTATEGLESGSLTLGILPSLNQVSALSSKGEIQFETIEKAIKQCTDCCHKLYPVMQECLVKAVKAKMSEKGT